MRIVIAEDSVLLRAGLTRLLADAGEEVGATGTASCGGGRGRGRPRPYGARGARPSLSQG